MHLSFLWWNTGLSPLGNNRGSKEEINFTKDFVQLAIDLMNIDFLALGEIGIENIKDLETVTGDYEIINGIEEVGRTKFTTCIIYNPETIKISREYVGSVAEKGSRTYKIAQTLSIKSLYDDTEIFVFVSHWPSRRTFDKGHDERAYYGQKLRDIINETDGNQCRNSHVILMGDFNDEPFDSSLTEHLMSTRERPTTPSRKHLLYNPFWRKLGYEKPFSNDHNRKLVSAGSCYYASEKYSRWKTFDQIIFSSTFLGDSTWKLDEDYTDILSSDYILEQILSRQSNFDHLPVISAIKKVQNHDQL
ncbi:endonuclease/exonuclease/phosphatase family protein [Marinobacter zhanjiangensis]|uniref:Endonuclease/exonuclease/phosphatase domain-containing protein n=1 Tax=Marinobacter zhanjiangensis TaxID=578215 RepID=A0ABQ3AV39_9GAMM|nr:endonuclease/exonuclease/phosphatase family protein [Marinobacter zhanjiangensis]GGY68770.1 hypothetical protein GCM10007071_14530 [Marinobacter zhanjiangensis]